ncbi:MAG TPA: DUF4440 domain-containing protein [Thermoanaerobaculia bacterium]|nr:DUF4440 domain-containing protein [Thermoanaerobaculia bacterium]
MRTRILPAIVLLLVACSHAHDDDWQLRNAVRQYDDYVHAMDAAHIADMFVEDGEVAHAGQVLAHGRAGIRTFLESFNGVVRVEENDMTIETVTVHNDTATVTGTYKQASAVLESGEVLRVRGKFESQWAKQPDGRWLMKRMETKPL